jgi:flagellar export protein FliJ
MKKFRFRLQALLKYEGFKVQQAQNEVANVRRDINTCEDRIVHMHSEISASGSSLMSEAEAGMDAHRYLRFKEFQEALAHKVAGEKVQRKELEKKHQRKMKQLKAASVKKKALENFKDRQQQKYYAKAEKDQAKTTEEMVLIREARKKLTAS